MAQVLKVADLGFVIAFRFYGRYPETGRSFYHPPPCDINNAADAEADATTAAAAGASENIRKRRRPGLASASSLIMPTLSARSLSGLFGSGEFRDLDDVLPSPAAVSVGAH